VAASVASMDTTVLTASEIVRYSRVYICVLIGQCFTILHIRQSYSLYMHLIPAMVNQQY